MPRVVLGLAFASAFTLLAVTLSSQTIDCGKASTPVERSVCTTPELKRLDSDVAALYFKALQQSRTAAERRAVGQAQLDWLAARNRCTQRDETERLDCLRTAYTARRDSLRGTPAPPQARTFRAEANYVEVTAVVTDSRGAFVSGLSKDDFYLQEEGRAQSVAVFSEVNLPVGSAGAAAPPMVRPGSRATALAQNATLSGRSYLLVLDGGPMTANDWMACDSLDDARRFVKDYLQPGDLAAVWEGDPGQVNFTTDPAVLLRNLTPSVGVSVRTELSGSKSGLDAAIGFLSSIQGTRKSLVFFSCGWIPWAFDMLAPNQPDLDLRARYFEANEGFQLASRSDVLIYACDARGLLTGAAAADQRGSAPRVDILASNGALKTLAEATGGFALVNGNDYGPGFAHIVEDNSHYYVLGYDSPIRGQDGRFINVNVRVDHSGLTVRARQGYFAK